MVAKGNAGLFTLDSFVRCNGAIDGLSEAICARFHLFVPIVV